MKKWMEIKTICLIGIVMTISFISFSYAKNVGTIGQIYSIDEEDFLEFIEGRAVFMQEMGALSDLKQTMHNKAEIYRDRPKPVAGVMIASQTKSWLYDPSIVLDHDVITPDGKIIAKNGQRINPLDYVPLKKTLIFYDADDKKEREWVVKLDKKLKGNDKLILVNGSVLSEENRLSKSIYFDQEGKLTSKFNIQHVPAIVEQIEKTDQTNNFLKITEVAL